MEFLLFSSPSVCCENILFIASLVMWMWIYWHARWVKCWKNVTPSIFHQQWYYFVYFSRFMGLVEHNWCIGWLGKISSWSTNLGPKSGVQVDGTKSLLQAMIHSEKWGTLLFVMLEILFWSLVAGFLHMKGIYIKMWNIKCTCCMLYLPCE